MVIDVKTKAYEGPLDLLLDLIKENKVDIYDIPIAAITDQYLKCLEQMQELNLNVAGEFLVMAATLLYIKSKMLLPEELQEEEEEDLDPRDDLVNKLLEYMAYKEAARDFAMLQDERKKVFTRGEATHVPLDHPEYLEDNGVTSSIFALIQAFSNVLKINSIETFHEIYDEEISIEEKVTFIEQRLAEKTSLRFSELFAERATKNELVATFLALLEMIRMKKLKIRQEALFGEIIIEKREGAL
jgi:segregation and condensation protein A